MNKKEELKKERKKIKDRDIFMSPDFGKYLKNQTTGMLLGTRKRVNTELFWDETNPGIAWADDSIIHINGGNMISMSFPTTKLKIMSYSGFNGHETGHILYSDFSELKNFKMALSSGEFYPEVPEAGNIEEQENLNDILFYFHQKDPVVLSIVSEVAGFLNNAIEDVWMEGKMAVKFPGNIKKGIIINAGRMLEQSQNLKKMIDSKKCSRFDICNSLVLQYVRSGNINNWQRIENEYTDFLYDAAITLDYAVCEDEVKQRMQAVNICIIKMWKMLREEIEEIRKLPQKPQLQGNQGQNSKSGQDNNSEGQKQQGSGTDKTSENQKAQPITEEERKKIEKFKTKLESSSEAKMFGDIKSHENKDSKPAAIKESISANLEEQKEFRQEFSDVIDQMENNSRFSTEGREAEFLDNFSEEYERIDEKDNAINRVLSNYLNQMAESNVNQKEEKDLKIKLETDFTNADLTKLHRVPRKIRRAVTFPPEYVVEYNLLYKDLKKISMRLQKEIQQVLIRKEGGIERGLYIGKVLDHHAYYRNNGKIFCKRNNPEDGISIAVGVVVDESGSMIGERIMAAKLASMVVYDFCRALNIPVCINGHAKRGNCVVVNSYAEFDSVDGNDRYRIMGMRAGGCNRDGLAYRYMGQKLSQRPEDVKILIIISDGQPNDDGYGGSVARDDLRQAKTHFKMQGIYTFAAAIGDDKETIREIYRDSFLDISNLERLPVNMVRLIQNYIN